MATEEEKQYPEQSAIAMFRPQTVDKENRTVEIVLTTGEEGERYDWWTDEPYLESLEISDKAVRTGRLAKGLSVLDNHDRYIGIKGVLGITEGWRIENGEIIATARFSKSQEQVFEDVADGILRHVSLGYRVHGWEVTPRGKSTPVEKRKAIDWEPTELSLVPVSFETTNGMRSAQQRNAEKTFKVKISYNQGDRKMDQPTIPAQEPQADDANRSLQTQQPAPTQERTVQEDARKLLPEYLSAARAAGLGDDFAHDAFMRGVALDDYRKQVIDKLAQTRQAGDIKSFGVSLNSDKRQDEGESLARAVEAALMHRTASKYSKPSEEAREFSGMTLMEIARELVERSGQRTKGMSRNKIADRAFHSTSDFPLILENVVNKNLMEAFQETPRTFLELGRRATVTDFRQKHNYKLGDAPSLQPLGEGGEYKAGTISESKESYAISTYASKIGFTRKMLINDDMSALDRIPRLMGAAGARLESDVVWGFLLSYDFFAHAAKATKLADGKDLFHSDHGNKLTTGSALSKESLKALRALGRAQKTLDGNFMNVLFSHIVVPGALESDAEDLLLPNILAAKIEDQAPRVKMNLVVEPRLDAVSSTAWYAFASLMDTFEYAYLDGEEEMYTEVVQSTDADGVSFLCRKDFGAGIVDHRGMAMATGAAK